jgi:hypothetical protein
MSERPSEVMPEPEFPEIEGDDDDMATAGAIAYILPDDPRLEMLSDEERGDLRGFANQFARICEAVGFDDPVQLGRALGCRNPDPIEWPKDVSKLVESGPVIDFLAKRVAMATEGAAQPRDAALHQLHVSLALLRRVRGDTRRATAVVRCWGPDGFDRLLRDGLVGDAYEAIRIGVSWIEDPARHVHQLEQAGVISPDRERAAEVIRQAIASGASGSSVDD